MSDAHQPDTRSATCACGALRVTLRGAPQGIYACACLVCQKVTGAAFAYRAKFADGQVTAVEGASTAWRRSSDAGRWVEHLRCVECGTVLFTRAEGLPGMIAVSVGCFADPSFPPPTKLVWASKRHRWYELPETLRLVK